MYCCFKSSSSIKVSFQLNINCCIPSSFTLFFPRLSFSSNCLALSSFQFSLPARWNFFIHFDWGEYSHLMGQMVSPKQNPGEDPPRVHGEEVRRSKDLNVLGRPLDDPLHLHQDIRQPLLGRHLHPAGDPVEHLHLYRWLSTFLQMA